MGVDFFVLFCCSHEWMKKEMLGWIARLLLCGPLRHYSHKIHHTPPILSYLLVKTAPRSRVRFNTSRRESKVVKVRGSVEFRRVVFVGFSFSRYPQKLPRIIIIIIGRFEHHETRSREHEYFIKEQEREIAEYIAKLKARGGTKGR